MDLIVGPNGIARFGGIEMRCAIGRSGLSGDKQEGDGATPIGLWPCRALLYRPDRLVRPESRLVTRALNPWDGWCDAPDDPAYNQPVRLPYPASAEELWRQDTVYDLIVPLGYNDQPIRPGRGSAIFLHLARDDYAPTEGCVALALGDFLAVLAGGLRDLICKEI